MSLRILKASAGSGKTYSLTETYIRYCLDPDNHLDYSNILAITFTNKASAEMKNRIMGLLYTLSQDPDQYPGIDSLTHDLGFTKEEIRTRSANLLYRILTEFDLFTITTIDSFFTRLYGSMTLDLFGDIPGEITLDADRALHYAADQIIAQSQESPDLKLVVIDLLEEKIREGEGVGLKNSLMKLGMELFNDDFLRLRQKSHYVEPARDFHQALTEAVEIINDDFKNFQKQLEELLNIGGMDHGDFTSSFTGSILKRKNLKDLLDLKGFGKIADPDQWFTKGKRDLMMSKVAPIQADLQDLGQRFFDFVNSKVRIHTTYSVVLKNYGAYRVLRFLYEAMQEYLQVRRLNFLSDINFKIDQKISEEDSMIVYEKLGQRIKAIMIDEFQDTSQIQWDNLRPLIQNNMAEGYPNLVVGDVKQAIYRFRSGNWEIMEIQVPEFKKRWDETEENLVDNLPFNWRSSPEIVSFNNEFFTKVSVTLSENLVRYKDAHFGNLIPPDHLRKAYKEMDLIAEGPRQVYSTATQSVPEQNMDQTGYVQIDYWSYDKDYPKDNIIIQRMDWLRTVLIEVFEQGYSGADIGILARGKKDLGVLSDYLSRWSETDARFRFSSEDSLKLDLSDGVQMLIAALKIKAGIDVRINEMVFSNYQKKLNIASTDIQNWEDLLPGGERDYDDILDSDLLRQSGIQQLSLFFESVILKTSLTQKSGQWPYLLSFIEEVKKFELQNGPDIRMFLDEWEQRIRKVKIQMSDDIEKLRLYTIHKSKGLEFEIVLLPFGDWDFEITGQQNILWVENHEDSILKLAGPLPVNYTSALIQTSFDYAYVTEYLRNVMDNLNLLYVAMTRPRKRLYVRLQEKERKKSDKSDEKEKPVKNTLDLFHMRYPELGFGSVEKGSKQLRVSDSLGQDSINKVGLNSYSIRQTSLPLQLRPSFDGSQDESVGRGLIIHGMLEDLRYAGDIQNAVSKAILEGEIRESEREEWIGMLQNIVGYEPVRDFYLEGWKVHNEKSIMVVGGGEYRPDRIQENGREYVVIDYKTGSPLPGHLKQITRYKSIIESMVTLPVRSYIYYPMIPKLIEVK